MNGYLQVIFVDVEADQFVTLGGAGFDTMALTRAEFARIPAVADSDIVLDLLRGDEQLIVDDKCISPATAEALLGDSIANLRKLAEARP